MQQQNVDVWPDLAHLATRSDVATMDSHSTSDDIDSSESDSTSTSDDDIDDSHSTTSSTSDDIDGSDSASIATEYSDNIDVLGEHRVIIVYACSPEKVLDKIAPAVVREYVPYSALTVPDE